MIGIILALVPIFLYTSFKLRIALIYATISTLIYNVGTWEEKKEACFVSLLNSKGSARLDNAIHWRLESEENMWNTWTLLVEEEN